MTPARCGVSDCSLFLAGELENAFGLKTAIAVVNSTERCAVPFPTVYCSPAQLLEGCLSLCQGQPGNLLVHLSGYGYSADGVPTALARTLEAIAADGRFRIAVFFHELYATGMPWKSAFWNTGRQKRELRKIVRACDLLVTNISHNLSWLEREAVHSSGQIQCLPVFSHAGEARKLVSFADRDPAMAVFGLGAHRQMSFKKLSALSDMLHQLNVQEIVDIGPGFEPPLQLSDIPVRSLGVLPANEIARQFSRTVFGFVSYPPFCLAKSGVFAGYCAHGVVPVVEQPFSGSFDGLVDGVHVLSPRTAQAVQVPGVERCSKAAWQWYAGHRLHDHAAIYARWIGRTGDKERIST